MKSMLPGVFPERAFSAEYMLKDIRYALDLAHDAELDLRGARTAFALLEEAIADGHGREYWPVLYKVVERSG
jgi:3-hydroxyisobutyrate dehydrogenase-like beta-hydroxyacid dehydrogenase